MIDISQIDYSFLDKPEIIYRIFSPRPEGPTSQKRDKVISRLIPVEQNISVGVRFHLEQNADPTILLFHGNGEIAADYDGLAPLFLQAGINLAVADYRGYGCSTGTPTITAMMRDCHVIYEGVKQYLREMEYDKGPFVIMGRSLGSASALELAFHYEGEIDGLIVESGFARMAPLLTLLGIYLGPLGIGKDEGPANMVKINSFRKPTLIIHAEYDHIIPYAEAQALFDASGADHKKLTMIPDANHNDLFFRDERLYMQSLSWLMESIKKARIAAAAAKKNKKMEEKNEKS